MYKQSKKINKLLLISLSTILISINIPLVNAPSGALRQDSIKECNGKKYGQHGKDNHWHEAKYTPRDRGSDFTAIGQPFYSDPCTSQKIDNNKNNTSNSNTNNNGSSTSKNNSNNTNSNTKTNSSNSNNTNSSSKNNNDSSLKTNNNETKNQTNIDKIEEKQTNDDKTNETNNVVKEEKPNDNIIDNTKEENNSNELTNNEESSDIFDVIIGGAIFLGAAIIGSKRLLKK